MKIVSGGQTGVDRAALDVALKHGVDCGGWCPAGRLDEFGRIPEGYPVTELPNGDAAARTRQNVIDSDGTVIFHSGELRGGAEYTLQCCKGLGRPYLVIDAAKTSAEAAATSIMELIRGQTISVLNIAGPRQSEWPEGYDYVFAVLNMCFADE